MRTKEFSKEQLQTIDSEIKKFIKVTLNLVGPAASASNDYIYGATEAGCLGIPCLADEHDIICVDSAFKLLSSQDPAVRRIAWENLSSQISSLISTCDQPTTITPPLTALFLSGSLEPPFHRGQSNYSSVWTFARAASRRLGSTWTIPEWGDISLSFQSLSLGPGDRRRIQKSLKHSLRTNRVDRLLKYKSQGVAMECVAGSKWGNSFLRTGDNIRFCDWRFIHKARLNLCNLNSQRAALSPEPLDPSCRRCSYPHETLQHVVSNCKPLLHLRTQRHDAIVSRLIKARRRGWRVYGQNCDVDGSGLRPDIVLYQGGTAILLDVAVPYENRLRAFKDTRDAKIQKYSDTVSALKRSFKTVHADAIIVGALGSWDRENDRVLKKFVNRRYANKLRKLICTDTIGFTCDIFHKHVRGHLPSHPRFTHPNNIPIPARTVPVAGSPPPPGLPPFAPTHPSPSTDHPFSSFSSANPCMDCDPCEDPTNTPSPSVSACRSLGARALPNLQV